jgi:hypothetical protein
VNLSAIPRHGPEKGRELHDPVADIARTRDMKVGTAATRPSTAGSLLVDATRYDDVTAVEVTRALPRRPRVAEHHDAAVGGRSS